MGGREELQVEWRRVVVRQCQEEGGGRVDRGRDVETAGMEV